MADYQIALLKGFSPIKIFNLVDGETLLGRGEVDAGAKNYIDLGEFDTDLKVSKEHAQIVVDDTGVYIEDLASTNGTLINCSEELGAHCARYLEHGDQILIGKLLLEFRVLE